MYANIHDSDGNMIPANEVIEDVKEAFERFWMNNELGYDKFGNVVRTDIKRRRPPDWQEKLWKTLKRKDK